MTQDCVLSTLWKQTIPEDHILHLKFRHSLNMMMICSVRSLWTSFLKWANPGLFLFIFVFSNTNLTVKTVGFSRIRTRIVGVEGKHADHLTPPPRPSVNFFNLLVRLLVTTNTVVKVWPQQGWPRILKFLAGVGIKSSPIVYESSPKSSHNSLELK